MGRQLSRWAFDGLNLGCQMTVSGKGPTTGRESYFSEETLMRWMHLTFKPWCCFNTKNDVSDMESW